MKSINDNYYAILEVPETASQADLRAAYRRLIRLSHPDYAVDDEDRRLRTKRTAALTAAWYVLSDPARRAAYDVARRAQSQNSSEIRPDTAQFSSPPSSINRHCRRARTFSIFPFWSPQRPRLTAWLCKDGIGQWLLVASLSLLITYLIPDWLSVTVISVLVVQALLAGTANSPLGDLSRLFGWFLVRMIRLAIVGLS